MAVTGGFYSYAEESVAVGPDGMRNFFCSKQYDLQHRFTLDYYT